MTPRPPVLFTAVFGAGLATGLLRIGSPLAIGAVALVAVLASRRPTALLLGAALLLGRIGGEVAWLGEREQCNARLPAGELTLRVRLDEPAGPEGGDVGVTPDGAGCTGAVRARWPRRLATDAGLRAQVRARWLPRAGSAGRPRGTLVVQSRDRIDGTPGLGERLRSALARESLQLYGSRAPIVDALVLNSRAGMDRELQDRFAQSGLVHLLSISGFHVGLVAAWIVLVARLAGVRRDRALVAGAVVGAAYVAFLGWPAPATRAAALTAVLARCRSAQRHVQADPLLAATCLAVMLVDPWAVLDLGAWLSATALWGAMTFARWTDRALGASFWWRTLGSSVGATLATAPITAGALGTVALVGIALNFAAIPIAALAVPGVIASLLVLPLSEWAAGALAAGAGALLRGLELLAAAGARVPYGHSLVEPGPAAAVPWVGVLILALWSVAGGNPLREAARRWGWAAAVGLWVPLLSNVRPLSADGAHRLALHFLDVGQGDATAIRTPGGHWVLIDAGPRDERRDAGRSVVAPFLLAHGARRVSVAVLSHAHLDHLGGLDAVLDRVPADLILEPGELSPDPLYTRLLDRIRAGSVRWHVGRPGDRFEIDSVRFSVLHPSAGWDGWGEDLNEDSLVLLVEYRDFQAVFAGDAGFPAESAMGGRLRRVDLLKVGHHGSRGSTSDRWLATLRPEAAVISVGRGNRYGHPTAEALARLARAGVRVWRTDRDGAVTVTTDGSHMTVHAGDGRAEFDVNLGERMQTSVTTIERFIMDQEDRYPEATGELSNLLYDVALASKLIAAAIRRAGLVNILGTAGAQNVQGEEQQKLDVFANETIKNCLQHTGRVCVMGSEEDEGIIPVPTEYEAGKYAVLFDPLDGSSNIDVNSAVGTIFSIYRRRSSEGRGTSDDVLQPGCTQVAAGYVMYGSSTMLVYTTGQGVHGFTLDPTIGEFLLSHERIVTPRVGKYYSVNESNFGRWDKGIQTAVRGLKGDIADGMAPKNSRYIGSLVADFHRNLITGGVFLYPGDAKNPYGKLRLLYEASPMAFIAEQAQGSATDGTNRILDIMPVNLHQRTPLVIGSREDVGFVADTLRRVALRASGGVAQPAL